jgi:hypothetical protein
MAIEVRLSKPTGSGGSPQLLPASVTAVKGAFYFVLLMPGLLGCMVARGVYPLLDDRSVMGLILGLFLLPVALQMLSVLRKSAVETTERFVRIVHICAGFALVLLALLLFLNGGMDKAPGAVMRTPVMRKVVLRGRRATQYRLIVWSWRPGRSSEDLGVTSSVFYRVGAGKMVAIEVHKGNFNMPWLGKISPD